MAHPNEVLLRKGYDAFAKGDLDTIRGLFAPDIVWTVPGRSPLAGTYKGIDEVFGLFAELVKRSEGTFQIELHDVLANDQHAVALATLNGRRGNRTLNVHDVATYHVKNGRVTEAWFASEDEYAQDEFWS